MRHAVDKVFKTTLGILCGYTLYDASSDATMYIKAKSWIEEGMESRPDIVHTLNHVPQKNPGTEGTGPRPRLGPWYDSSVMFSHQGMVATITIPCRGEYQASDVIIKAIRKGGMRSTLMYNMTGGKWDIVCMDALLGMQGSTLVSVSLLDSNQALKQ